MPKRPFAHLELHSRFWGESLGMRVSYTCMYIFLYW